MNFKSLVFRYAFFAFLAIVANLITQRFVLWFGENGLYFIVAMGMGTFVGLVLKYILDKRWIFMDHSTGIKAHSQRFSLYTAMGLFTTILFWGSETLFWFLWKTNFMREIGAILGLTIGYLLKYNLDKRYVFDSSDMVKLS